MICTNCQTILPDQAIACWKCGTPTTRAAAQAPGPLASNTPDAQAPVDLLLIIVTFLMNGAFFLCAGWSVPFTIWGMLVSAAKDRPDLAGVLEVASGAALVISAIVFFVGCWWGSYWVLMRLFNPGAKPVAPAPASPVAPPQPGVAREPADPENLARARE